MAATVAVLEPPAPPIAVPRHPAKSAVHRLALAFVWLTIAISAVVFTEPAPVDAFALGLIILLPLIGLTLWPAALTAGLTGWLMIAGLGLIAALSAKEMDVATTHTLVTLYLAGFAAVIAAFVARHPAMHTRLLLNAYLLACLMAACAGIVGYFGLVPGASELFTLHGRAAGTFKDPNVFGPFLVAGVLTTLHMWLTRPLTRALLPLAALTILMGGVLLSFSRGAWAAAIFAVVLYSYLYLLTAKRDIDRLKLGLLLAAGAAVAGLLLSAALQSVDVERLLSERATLVQPYDAGPEGRFGGQIKAAGLILEHPLGLGAGMFARYHHHEEAHNVYLTMLMAHGWVGGLLYFIVCAATIGLGFRHALRPTRTQPLFLIVYAALTANILQGVLIDTDHWRHFYLLLGIVWGLMAGDTRIPRTSRILADRRPMLRHPLLIIPPSRRNPRLAAAPHMGIGPAQSRLPSAPRRRYRARRVERRCQHR